MEKKKTTEAALVAAVNEATGIEVPVEIDWEGFSNKMDDCGYIDDSGHGLSQLAKALAAVTVDDLGKEAIKGALKKIVIKPAADNGATSFTFSGGVVTWSAYFGSSSTGYIYADAMQKAIEQAL
ncbi:MAG: hypothetical protein INH41_11310 [Myxococcaceae bacterium]|nr:hypothetical protein [Myxococcaceae bacterium]